MYRTEISQYIGQQRLICFQLKEKEKKKANLFSAMQVVVEIPYVFFQGLFYTVIVYAMMSFQWTAAKFIWFFFISFCSFLYFTYYGMMTVSISPNHQVAAIFAATFYSLFNLFSGFFIPRPVSSPSFHNDTTLFTSCYHKLTNEYTDNIFAVVVLQRIPKWWIWYYWMCPLAWTVYGLIVSQYGDLNEMISVPGQSSQTIKSYVEDHFGYDTDFMGVVATVLVGFSVFFAFTFAFCIRTLNFQQR